MCRHEPSQAVSAGKCLDRRLPSIFRGHPSSLASGGIARITPGASTAEHLDQAWRLRQPIDTRRARRRTFQSFVGLLERRVGSSAKRYFSRRPRIVTRPLETRVTVAILELHA